VKRRFLIVYLSAALALCAGSPAFAAGDNGSPASQYSLGDQTLSINPGMFLPLFLVGGSPQIGSTNLSVGGFLSIDWAAYLSAHWRIGASLGGTFTFDPNWTALLMVPIVAKISYLIDFYPWEVPITFGAGMNILKYSADSTIDLLLKPGTGLLWTYNSSWSFGVNLNWWWDMQFTNASSLGFVAGNFLELSLSAFYHY
jgi:hypothetical protein